MSAIWGIAKGWELVVQIGNGPSSVILSGEADDISRVCFSFPAQIAGPQIRDREVLAEAVMSARTPISPRPFASVRHKYFQRIIRHVDDKAKKVRFTPMSAVIRDLCKIFDTIQPTVARR